MKRQIAVSIGNADEKYCNDCLHQCTDSWCPIFHKRNLSEIDKRREINGGWNRIRHAECIAAEIKHKGE